MNGTLRLLISFLDEEKVETSKKNADVKSLDSFIARNFNVLDEKVLRLLITRAMRDREENIAAGVVDQEVLGHWGQVIDTIKAVTILKRDLAVKNFQTLVSIGNNEGRVRSQCSDRHCSGIIFLNNFTPIEICIIFTAKL